MLTVEDFGQIRRAHRDGMSIRAIARLLHRSRRKVRDALAAPEPRPYTRTKATKAPKLDAVKPFIDQILSDDERAPPKQRHTAMQVFRRLVQEQGYLGKYDQVRRYVGLKRRRERETFIPLSHEPGQRAEADFGQIAVDFPEGRRLVPVLIVVWASSYAPFAIALPTQRTEAILHGLVAAFEFFGCVPRELWWDNPATVVAAILSGRQRTMHPRYAALASHYTFEPLFCMPARGNEKPHVENRVKDLERRWATPVPRVRDLAELNVYLGQCCLADRQRVATGQSESIGSRFERDRAAALALPSRAFDPCISQAAKVDKYQTVRFDNCGYSVPRRFAFQIVTVKAYVDQVQIVVGDQVIAQHARSYERGEQALDPLHYLTTLARKPACLDHSAVYRHWQLPPQFAELRSRLEAREGSVAGARQYARVLQLLGEHPAERVVEALEACRGEQSPRYDVIVRCTERLARRAALGTSSAPANLSMELGSIHVPLPDLSRFDQLLFLGDHEHGHESTALTQEQPQAVAFADHGSRV